MGSLFQFPSLIIWIIAIPLGIFFLYRYFHTGGMTKTISKTAKILHVQPSTQSIRALREQPTTPTLTSKPITLTKNLKYKALAITDEGLKYIRLSERLGNNHMIDPTMPHHGSHYLVKEITPGADMYEPYEPRDAPYLSKETPQKAYRAIRWPVVGRIFAYKNGALEHINLILAGIIAVGLIILMLQVVDKLSK